METIETPRLILRGFRQDDAADLFEYLHQPVSSCFLSLAVESMSEAEMAARKRGASEEYVAVCLKQSNRLVGDLFAMQEDDTFSIGWNFNPRFGGVGYAYEAAAALVDDLFTRRAARRLYAYVEDTNVPSQRLCEKLNMRREGVFMEFVSFKNDRFGTPIYENTMQYAILRKEWSRS
ncbi:GNAT family N-acetyltransferase [Burkholderia plantarii]|uniref:GNAT family N-acetyltransferase n=1 Tax=Burkholderia plantarii TaxID=41899 RepID=UPI00272BF4FD|nr:GNAT family protein [Burkholderia plantarii]WLE61819.1 GNAT family N-acetyltransferase [Burkholderia plantarii]